MDAEKNESFCFAAVCSKFLTSRCDRAMVKKSRLMGVSWCCGNYCLLAIVLWCGCCSVSFQSFVLPVRHLVIAPVRNNVSSFAFLQTNQQRPNLPPPQKRLKKGNHSRLRVQHEPILRPYTNFIVMEN